jgi:tRNA threonylcarbamoyladenosine biosynthesis protein TsaB
MRRIVKPRPGPGAVKPTLAPLRAPGDDPPPMPSLHQILAAQAPLLVLDAASARIQAGLLAADGTGRWETSEDEAGTGLFRCVEALGVDLAAVRAFAFCSGPGSILGIRTVAMALRAWEAAGGPGPRPIFAYGSLALVAAALGPGSPSVIADARREAWHVFRPGTGLARVPAAGVPEGAVMPEGFRHWQPVPAGTGRVPYLVADLLARAAACDLFEPAPDPDAYLPEEPSYVTWTPQLHRAP